MLASVCCAATASAQQVSLTLRDGRATLTTQNASVRQILAEWERQGGVKVVNVDRLAATQPVTITLSDVPEREALDIVLRGIPGYMAVERVDGSVGTSRYDRLVLLARTSTPTGGPATTAAAGRTAAPVPSLAQPADQVTLQQPDRGDVDQFVEEDGAEPPMPAAPVVSPYPAGSTAAPGGAPASNVLNSGGGQGVGVQPETQFDYANPQAYFERMRQQQAAQGQVTQPGSPTAAAPPPGAYPGAVQPPDAVQPPGVQPPGAVQPNAAPTGRPGATGTLAQPGIAPPAATPPQQQQFFNPYNLPPDQLPQGGGTTGTGTTTPVEPDRSKYANPYLPTPSTTTRPPQ